MAHFSRRYRYRFGDIDDAGIAYYPALLHYFHCAFEDWWQDALGIPYPELMHGEKVGFPAVRLEVDFGAPIRYGDEPWIHVGVLDIGRSSVRFGFWITRGEHDTEPLCRAAVTTVAVDMDHLTKLPEVPLRWREAFAGYRLEPGELPEAGPNSRGK